MRRMFRRKVVINTKTDQTFRGVLWSRLFGVWTIKKAFILKATGETVPVDGEVVVLRENIDFVQVLP